MELKFDVEMNRADLTNEVIEYSKKYFDDFLAPLVKKRQELINNNWLALLFLLDRIYFQARRDDISRKVSEIVKEVICELKIKYCTLETLITEGLKSLEIKLSRKIGKGLVGMRRDIDMTLSLLNFISLIPDHNILRFFKKKFDSNKVDELYFSLQTIKGVGPKIASFILRDFAVIYDLDHGLSKEFQIFLQPIDIWVKKVGILLGLYESTIKSEEIIKYKIVDFCFENNLSPNKLSPARFNQGMWYFGYTEKNRVNELLKSLSCH